MNTIQYEALEDSIKIDDIATNDNNRLILRRIKRNDESDTYNLWIQNQHDQDGEECEDYVPEGAHDMGWLGHFISKNDQLETLIIKPFTPPSDSSVKEVLTPFFKGVCNNKSIHKLNFCHMDLFDGKLFSMLHPFFENSPALTELYINDCQFIGNDGCRLCALAIGSSKTKSLQKVTLLETNVSDDGLVDIVTSLSMHPRLQHLDLDGNRLGINGCKALATLLQHSATELEYLNLSNNEIDDEGIKALVPALKNRSHLEKLILNRNSSITIKGWQQFATILEASNSNLEVLYNQRNNVDDEALAKFASALVYNHSLKTLNLGRINWSTDSYFAFSNILCDTSSIDSTYRSNHTFLFLGILPNANPLRPSLELNDRENKKEVAMIKILKHHNEFDMTPFFEWEFKALPLIIDWFERASSVTMPEDYEPNFEQRKLSSIYQFVRGMPLLYVETRLRKELEDIKVAQAQMKEAMRLNEERKRIIIEQLGVE